MLLIRAILIWAAISLHIVGAAVVFRRIFPRESPWFGFFVPPLAFVLIANFLEHMVAIPSFLWLLPFTTTGFGAALLSPRTDWRGLRLPTLIFLGSFAFCVTLRAVHPDISVSRDGIPDLALMSSFCMGQKVPPPFVWYPVLPLSHYYATEHYGASVLTRLFCLDVGTGFNFSVALVSTFDCLLAAATAWRISRQKLWVTLLAPIVFESAGTGSTPFLWLITTTDFYPHHAQEILEGIKRYPHLLHWMHQSSSHNELVPPGAWSWLGSLHSTCGGVFVVLFYTWTLVELVRRRKADWPWICAGVIPLITMVTSTYAIPLQALLLATALIIAGRYKLAPPHPRFVILAIALAAVLLAPTLLEFLTTAVALEFHWTTPECRTQLYEFVFQWWPIALPCLALIFTWRRLPPFVKAMIFLFPVAFLLVEFITLDMRIDWTSKMWSYLYGMAWIVLFPAICAQRGIFYRSVTFVLLLFSLVSFLSWEHFTWTQMDRDVLHLEGTGTLRSDPLCGAILKALGPIKGQTIITGRPTDLYGGSAPLASFTRNDTFVSWTFFDEALVGGPAYGGAYERARKVDELYDGKCANPLLFLRTNNIAALVIFPGDEIPPAVVARLKEQLAPYYSYDDFSNATTSSGIFIFHPELMLWPRPVLMPKPLPAGQNPAL